VTKGEGLSRRTRLAEFEGEAATSEGGESVLSAPPGKENPLAAEGVVYPLKPRGCW
jgi:hypothetical protein